MVTISAVAAAERNVLLLLSDNQNWNDLGCYGNPVVKTPHLDKLAAKGIRFNYAFATTASCSPSRSVIYTGLHSHANGMYGLHHSFCNFHLLPHVKTVFELLADAGYKTAVIGKGNIDLPHHSPNFHEYRINSYDVAGMAKTATKDHWLLRYKIPANSNSPSSSNEGTIRWRSPEYQKVFKK
ncbi:MAG: sulfatase-like hydrolase/transferase [Planctomycetota bacterium]|jgi:N-sulfoglucosamine sulfohydrolase